MEDSKAGIKKASLFQRVVEKSGSIYYMSLDGTKLRRLSDIRRYCNRRNHAFRETDFDFSKPAQFQNQKGKKAAPKTSRAKQPSKSTDIVDDLRVIREALNSTTSNDIALKQPNKRLSNNVNRNQQPTAPVESSDKYEFESHLDSVAANDKEDVNYLDLRSPATADNLSSESSFASPTGRPMRQRKPNQRYTDLLSETEPSRKRNLSDRWSTDDDAPISPPIVKVVKQHKSSPRKKKLTPKATASDGFSPPAKKLKLLPPIKLKQPTKASIKKELLKKSKKRKSKEDYADAEDEDDEAVLWNSGASSDEEEPPKPKRAYNRKPKAEPTSDDKFSSDEELRPKQKRAYTRRPKQQPTLDDKFATEVETMVSVGVGTSGGPPVLVKGAFEQPPEFFEIQDRDYLHHSALLLGKRHDVDDMEQQNNDENVAVASSNSDNERDDDALPPVLPISSLPYVMPISALTKPSSTPSGVVRRQSPPVPMSMTKQRSTQLDTRSVPCSFFDDPSTSKAFTFSSKQQQHQQQPTVQVFFDDAPTSSSNVADDDDYAASQSVLSGRPQLPTKAANTADDDADRSPKAEELSAYVNEKLLACLNIPVPTLSSFGDASAPPTLKHHQQQQQPRRTPSTSSKPNPSSAGRQRRRAPQSSATTLPSTSGRSGGRYHFHRDKEFDSSLQRETEEALVALKASDARPFSTDELQYDERRRNNNFEAPTLEPARLQCFKPRTSGRGRPQPVAPSASSRPFFQYDGFGNLLARRTGDTSIRSPGRGGLSRHRAPTNITKPPTTLSRLEFEDSSKFCPLPPAVAGDHCYGRIAATVPTMGHTRFQHVSQQQPQHQQQQHQPQHQYQQQQQHRHAFQQPHVLPLFDDPPPPSTVAPSMNPVRGRPIFNAQVNTSMTSSSSFGGGSSTYDDSLPMGAYSYNGDDNLLTGPSPMIGTSNHQSQHNDDRSPGGAMFDSYNKDDSSVTHVNVA